MVQGSQGPGTGNDSLGQGAGQAWEGGYETSV